MIILDKTLRLLNSADLIMLPSSERPLISKVEDHSLARCEANGWEVGHVRAYSDSCESYTNGFVVLIESNFSFLKVNQSTDHISSCPLLSEGG